jgi:hypothetical protein
MQKRIRLNTVRPEKEGTNDEERFNIKYCGYVEYSLCC